MSLIDDIGLAQMLFAGLLPIRARFSRTRNFLFCFLPNKKLTCTTQRESLRPLLIQSLWAHLDPSLPPSSSAGGSVLPSGLQSGGCGDASVKVQHVPTVRPTSP